MRMSLQQVKIACLQYDHTIPLFEGAVKIEGVDAAFETATILEANSQMFPEDWGHYGIMRIALLSNLPSPKMP
jgi:hypothetical protein